VASASAIAHAGLVFANPMSEAAVDAAVEALPLPAAARVLDAGCGNGELLFRVLRAHPGTRGVGVDLDDDVIAQARRRAGELPAEFRVAGAATVTDRVDAVVNVGASHALGGFPAALKALRERADIALYGEGYWRHPPSGAFLQALGGASADELSDLPGLRDAVAGAGFTIRGEWPASDADWAHYEETLAANAERDGGAETAAYARRIRDRRALADGTDTLGFALLVLGP
jgi:SAM-dependent methyltransferase